MRSWLLHARESFWFLPTLFGIGAIALALGLVELDRLVIDAGVTTIPLVADLSATGGRAILAAIGGTMLGVAATSFSITISVLATTSSAYGPRLVRNFMADRGNQVVLAVLTSTFLYALIVLRSVHTEADSSYTFVPVIAVSFAVVLAIGDVAVLVYFIHHIAASVQVTTLQKRVLTELETVIDLLHPETNDEQTGTDVALLPHTPGAVGPAVVSRTTGYVARVHIETLVALATAHDRVYRIVAIPGTYVLVGDPLAHAEGAAPVSVEQADEIAAAFRVEPARTPHQDIRFAVQQVVEIGVRGLASGTNDPYTAVSALDAVGGALATLCVRPTPSGLYRDSAGAVRVLCDWPDARSLIGDTYLAIRSYGTEHPLVVRAAIEFSFRLARVARGELRSALRGEIAALAASLHNQDPISRTQIVDDFAALDDELAHPRHGS